MIKSLESVTLPLVKLHSLKQVTAHCLLGDSHTAFYSGDTVPGLLGKIKGLQHFKAKQWSLDGSGHRI